MKYPDTTITQKSINSKGETIYSGTLNVGRQQITHNANTEIASTLIQIVKVSIILYKEYPKWK